MQCVKCPLGVRAIKLTAAQSTKSAGAVTVNLLDSRAATHEKLGNLDAALKDGRNMIEMSKGEVQGYLRTAKVLQQLNKADLALKIYERGLRLVPAKQLNYEVSVYSYQLLSPIYTNADHA